MLWLHAGQPAKVTSVSLRNAGVLLAVESQRLTKVLLMLLCSVALFLRRAAGQRSARYKTAASAG